MPRVARVTSSLFPRVSPQLVRSSTRGRSAFASRRPGCSRVLMFFGELESVRCRSTRLTQSGPAKSRRKDVPRPMHQAVDSVSPDRGVGGLAGVEASDGTASRTFLRPGSFPVCNPLDESSDASPQLGVLESRECFRERKTVRCAKELRHIVGW